jgi:protein-disulfide isomerase
MKRHFLAVFIACNTAVSAYAEEPEICPIPEPNQAVIDAVIRKLEGDGALDQAVERALMRVIKRQQEARRAEEAQSQAQLEEHATTARPVSSKRDHIRGNPSAEVSLIEYTDFECPFCKRFHSTPKALLERFGSRVNWVLRHFPLPFHEPTARQEAVASECAARLGGNDAFWKYTDAIFERTRSNGRGLSEENALSTLAVSMGLNADPFARCLRDDKIAKRIDEDMADGSAVGIQGTPTTVIRNNRTGVTEVKVGALPPEALAEAIERLLGAGK